MAVWRWRARHCRLAARGLDAGPGGGAEEHGGRVQPVRAHARIAVLIALVVAVTVAIGPGDAEAGQALPLAVGGAVDRQEQQVVFFGGGHGIKAFAQAGEEVEVAFVGLVNVGYGHTGQFGMDAG